MSRTGRSLSREDLEEALTSPAYRRILAATIEQARSVKEICSKTELPVASVYRNVKSLEDRGLLMVERSAMTSDGKPYDLYRARIEHAYLKVSKDGVQVTWRINQAIEDRILHMWNYLRG